MKKSIPLLVLACLLMTSCLKEGFNDFDALNHEFTLQGEVSPTLGVPIGTGTANIYNMINMIQISMAKMEVDSHGIMALTYDTTIHTIINLKDTNNGDDHRDKKHHAKNGPKDDEIVHVSKNFIEGAIKIDIFDNISFLNETDIEVDSLLVDLNAYVKAHSYDSAHAIQAMHDYHVIVYYNNISISVVGQDNQVYEVVTLPDSIPITDLIHGDYITLLDHKDISNAINKRPKEIRYTVCMNIGFTSDYFAMSGLSENEFVADSIGIRIVDIDADMQARFPISAYINDMQYNVDIKFEPSFHLDDLTIDSSMLYIQCKNGIPFEFTLEAQFLDANNTLLCDILDPSPTTIAGADVALDPASNLYTSTGQKETLVKIPITKTVYDALLNTSKIRLSAAMSTSPTGNPLRNRVSIKASDELTLRVWAKLKPTYTLHLDIPSNSNTEGGVQ